MATSLKGKWSIKTLMQITNEVASSRFFTKERDVIRSAIQIKKFKVFDGKNPKKAKIHFQIYSASFPQYYPYYTKYDSRGRERSYQRTYRHEYLVQISLERLSINTPIKIITGSDKKYVFNVSKNLIRSKQNPHGRYLSVGDYNIEVWGINPDHFFTQSWIRKQEDCLFGRNFANGPPIKANPSMVPFCGKHELLCLETLINSGFLKND